jgi:uncharacterized membrane protein
MKIIQEMSSLKQFTGKILFASLLILLIAACSRQPLYPSPPQTGSDVVIDTAQLKPEVPLFFTFKSGDKNVNFFVLKIQDKVLSFLDACVTCYTHKQGYRYDDGVVVCRACSQRFPVYSLEKGIGNCYPIKIAGRIEKDKYLISVSTLESSADKF